MIKEEQKNEREIIDILRSYSQKKGIKDAKLLIPNNCQYVGLIEGEHDLGELLHFIADMIE